MNRKPAGIAMTGWRSVAFYGSFFGLLGAAIYAVAIYPMLHVKEYQDIQKVSRRGIDQDKIQPGNMKVWSDPFDRDKKK